MRVRLSEEGKEVPRMLLEAGRKGNGRGTVVKVQGGGVCSVSWDETGREGECRVGKGGAMWLAVERDEVLVGSRDCPGLYQPTSVPAYLRRRYHPMLSLPLSP
eukprot:2637624-Rhodomonas_salina.3